MILSEQEKNRIRGLHKNNSVIKENNHGAMTWTCEQQPNSTPPCQCVPTPNWGGPGPGAYSTQAECMQASNCCGQTGGQTFACMGGVFQWGSNTCVGPGNYSMGQANVQAVFQTMADCQTSTCGGGGQEWACMGGPSANGCQSGPVGSFQIGQGGVMGIYPDQNTCVGSCTSGFGWACNPTGAAGCVQTAAGQYTSMSQCQAACGSYGNDKYKCVNNSCTAISPTDPGYNSASFLTLSDCEDSMCGDRRTPIHTGPKADMPVDNTYARKGNTDMERIKARALSEGELKRLIRKLI